LLFMTYATAQDMLDRYDAQELAQLAVPKEHVSIDAMLLALTVSAGDRSAYTVDDIAAADAALAKIQRALADATGEINGHLQSRYRLPLAVVPPNLQRYCCDIARFNLNDDHPPEHVSKRFDQAIDYLVRVAKGAISLGLDVDNAAAQTNDTVQFSAGG